MSGSTRIKAAGGVVWRQRDEGVEVLVVRRERYQDWSLPKGKLEGGESHREAAVREVREETGLECELGPKLTNVTYDTPAGPKRVKWWAMSPTAGSVDPEPGDPNEIAEVQWLPFGTAWNRVTYGTDRQVLGVFADHVLGYQHR